MGSGESVSQYADALVGGARDAAAVFATFDQDRVDLVVRAVCEAAYAARTKLAKLACAETGMGRYEDKVIKNAWASLVVYGEIREIKTVGVIHTDPDRGITQMARPKGPILATTPATNPTSTTISTALLCLKTRNPVIFSPHRGARKCVKETVRILAEAAEAAGAPPNAIQIITHGQKPYLDHVMAHPALAMILATGTSSIVDVAQRSGTPTFGVGPGNVPVYVHASADLAAAARAIMHSKMFDNGTVCASEQALVVEREVAAHLRPLLEQEGAYFCTKEQAAALGPVCFDTESRRMRPEAVGQPPEVLAARAGFGLPHGTRVIVAEGGGVGAEHPLSHELLMPVLAYYVCESYAAALDVCRAVIRLGGIGHTVGVHATDRRVVDDFATLDAARVLVNTPCTQGAIGGIFNGLRPSLTLGCGAGAGNMAADNLSIEHLLDIRRVAEPCPNRRWLDVRARTLDDTCGFDEILRTYDQH
ncbi:MAG: aldehyde dehydrogenase family protein [Acidobacteriota bacterium]